MKKVKVKTNNISVLQVLGFLLIAFAVVDFAISWAGINLTCFMGGASNFSPMIFVFLGATLLSAGKDGTYILSPHLQRRQNKIMKK